jgi:predicted membrane-bound mannosyltransferase
MAALSLSPLPVKQRLHTTGHLHYGGHFLVFALTAAALLWNRSPLRSQLWRAGVAALLGVALEAAQVIVYHSRLEKRDLLVDAAGVAAGFLVIRAVSRFRFRTRVSA